MSDYGGIWKVVPKFSALYMIIMLGAVGLPGLCGFVGEFLVLIGSYDHHAVAVLQGAPVTLPYPKLMTAAAALGVILSAVYLLMMFQKIFFGPIKHRVNLSLRDISGRELGAIVPLVVMTIALGLVPRPLLRRMEPAVKKHLAQYQIKYKASLDVKKAKKAKVLDRKALANLGAKLPLIKAKDRAQLVTKGRRARVRGQGRGRGKGSNWMKKTFPSRRVGPAGGRRYDRRGGPGARRGRMGRRGGRGTGLKPGARGLPPRGRRGARIPRRPIRGGR
jgi:hypothetical protein